MVHDEVYCVDDNTYLLSGGAKVGPDGARSPAVKPCAPAVPRQLSYDDDDHKRT